MLTRLSEESRGRRLFNYLIEMTVSNSKRRERRHRRVRAKIFGTKDKPRLAVFKSNKYIYGQIIDDEKGQTMVSSDTRREKKASPLAQAKAAGLKLAEKALKEGVKKVVFDRGGFLYAGRVKSFASGAREGGLEF
ncbi:MAG: large subunit ribosomal protein L18 [Parcubacteria group bacterium Gr01-1014_107]|nr:MAG: large subunit ribosomal protein L18 [Parcubacteria group bacterium Gr01-1014_107]